jgi:hypothetical protein
MTELLNPHDHREQLPDILALIRQLSEQQTAIEYLETVLRYLSGGTDRISNEDLQEMLKVGCFRRRRQAYAYDNGEMDRARNPARNPARDIE